MEEEVNELNNNEQNIDQAPAEGEEQPDMELEKQYTYAIAYGRVSTKDKKQDPEYQLMAIRKWAERKGDVIILKEFQDKSTGTNDDRPGLDSAYGYILRNHRNDKKHLITEFLVHDLDRFSRNKDDTNMLIRELKDMSVRLVMINEENVDMNNSYGRLVIDIKSTQAEGYVEGLGEKIKAGQDKARAQGKHIGRPLLNSGKFDTNLLIGLASMGYSLRDVSKVYNCSRITITRRLNEAGKLDEFKETYAKAISEGKVGPAMAVKNHKSTKTIE